MRTPGWYPDPSGRFEHRYHNGDRWTADVALDGQRYIDHAGASGAVPVPPRAPPPPRNGIATAGMVCGIVGLSLAWIPFLTVVGFVVAVVGVVLAGVGLRRSRPTGTGRAAAIAGLVTGGLGVAMSAVGVWLTVIVTRALDDFDNPEPSEARLTACTRQDGRGVAEGEITNVGDDTQSYTVTVELRTAERRRRERVEVDSVAPGERRAFTADVPIGQGEPTCRVLTVRGPLPFGIDAGLD